MLNVGPGEIVVILVAALLLLGPKRLPEVARALGKFLREFRRQTDEVRNLVEREFYRMDQDLEAPAQVPPAPAPGAPPQPPVAQLAPPLDPSLASTQKEPSLPYGAPVARESRPAVGAPPAPTPAAPSLLAEPLDASTASTQQLPTFVPASPAGLETRPSPEPAAPAPPPHSRQE